MGDTATESSRDLSGEIKLTHIIYALYALSILVGLTAIAGIIMNYVKRDDVKGTWLESHFNWQIRTFWWGLLWGVIGMITMVIGIGFIILPIAGIWVLYRIIKGWLKLNENKPVE
ncbi:MAG: hypothetical protein WCE43_13165 [Burkholderiales bacterium]